MAGNYAERELGGKEWNRKCVTLNHALNLFHGLVRGLVFD
jgi:hypothetical protein